MFDSLIPCLQEIVDRLTEKYNRFDTTVQRDYGQFEDTQRHYNNGYRGALFDITIMCRDMIDDIKSKSTKSLINQ